MASAPNKRIRLMILDDHQLILSGIGQMLSMQENIVILGSFVTSAELLAALGKEEPDLILVDYSLSPDDVDGLNLIRALKTRFSTVPILVMSALHTPAIAALVMRCGADGFIGKELSLADMLTAIRTVMNGRSYLSQGMMDKLKLNQIQFKVAHPSASHLDSNNMLALSPDLSKREQEVLRCCLDGMSVTQIAAKFSRSLKTISSQKQSAYKKLGVDNDNELFKIRNKLENL